MLLIKFILVFTFKKHSHVALRYYIAFDRRQLQLRYKKRRLRLRPPIPNSVAEPHHVHAALAVILLYTKTTFLKLSKFDIRVGAIFLLILYDWKCSKKGMEKQRNGYSLWHFLYSTYGEHQVWRGSRSRSRIT
jgi:hypothetical protein